MTANLYDDIRSPFDDNKILEKLIDIYAYGKSPSGRRKIEKYTDLYYAITTYGKEKETRNQEEYLEQFYKYIVINNCERLYQNLKKIDVNDYNMAYNTAVNRINDRNINEYEKEDLKSDLDAKSFYPLSMYSQIFHKFNTYEEFCDYYMHHLKEAHYLQQMYLYPSIKDTCYAKLKELNYSETEIEFLEIVQKLEGKIARTFYGGNGVMGFHVCPQKYSMASTVKEREADDIKFYLNAGIDTYKVAALFQQKCEAKNLNYYYKVVNARRNTNEYLRTDKMCIFSSYDNAAKFLEIIREIKKENPDINFLNPPLLTGTIDNYIGIGQDHISKITPSYNGTMSEICFNELDKMFNQIPREEISKYVEQNPEKLNELKHNIIESVKQVGLSETKICVKEASKDRLQKVLTNSTPSEVEVIIEVNDPDTIIEHKCEKKSTSSNNNLTLEQQLDLIKEVEEALKKQQEQKIVQEKRMREEKKKAEEIISKHLAERLHKLQEEFDTNENDMIEKKIKHNEELAEMFKNADMDMPEEFKQKK